MLVLCCEVPLFPLRLRIHCLFDSRSTNTSRTLAHVCIIRAPSYAQSTSYSTVTPHPTISLIQDSRIKACISPHNYFQSLPHSNFFTQGNLRCPPVAFYATLTLSLSRPPRHILLTNNTNTEYNTECNNNNPPTLLLPSRPSDSRPTSIITSFRPQWHPHHLLCPAKNFQPAPLAARRISYPLPKLAVSLS
jgi:hypothetical protein